MSEGQMMCQEKENDATGGMARPTANDELGYLQQIITEHEKHAFTVMAFMSAVIAGLGTAVLSWKLKLSPVEVLYSGIGAVCTFAVWTLSHRAVADRAIDRVRVIEEILAHPDRAYDSHSASTYLKNVGFGNWIRAARHITFWMPIIVALLAVAGISFLYLRNLEGGVGDGPNAVAIDAVKSQIAMPISLSATDSEATAEILVPAQICRLKIRKERPNSKWSVAAIACEFPPK